MSLFASRLFARNVTSTLPKGFQYGSFSAASSVAMRGFATGPSKPTTLTGKSLLASSSAAASLLTQQRNAGTSVLGCAIALIGVGGCAQGMGQVLAALIVGIARNPSMKEDLFTYTMICMGLLEVLALLIGLGAGVLYFSE